MKDLLEQRHTPCFIGGQYLVGAMGELPVTGLPGLYVDDLDADVAVGLITDYLSAEPIY